MLILPLNEDLPIRAPLAKGHVASDCCSQKLEKHRDPDGAQSCLGAVEVALHRTCHLHHPPSKGTFRFWETRAAPAVTFISLWLGGGFTYGDMVMYQLSQTFQLSDLT